MSSRIALFICACACLVLVGCGDRRSEIDALRREIAEVKAASLTPTSTPALGPTAEERARYRYLSDSVIVRIGYYAENDQAGRSDPRAPVVVDFVAGRRAAYGQERGQTQHQVFVSIRSSQCARDIEASKVGDPMPFSCWEIAAAKVLQDDARAAGIGR